jgi:hypothetical protein
MECRNHSAGLTNRSVPKESNRNSNNRFNPATRSRTVNAAYSQNQSAAVPALDPSSSCTRSELRRISGIPPASTHAFSQSYFNGNPNSGGSNDLPVNSRIPTPSKTKKLASSRPRMLKRQRARSNNVPSNAAEKSPSAISPEDALIDYHSGSCPESTKPDSEHQAPTKSPQQRPRLHSPCLNQSSSDRTQRSGLAGLAFEPLGTVAQTADEAQTLHIGSASSVIRFDETEMSDATDARPTCPSVSPPSSPFSRDHAANSFTGLDYLPRQHCLWGQSSNLHAPGDNDAPQSHTRRGRQNRDGRTSTDNSSQLSGPSFRQTTDHRKGENLKKIIVSGLSVPINSLELEGYDDLKKVLNRAKQKAPKAVGGSTASLQRSLHPDVGAVLDALRTI